MFIEGLLNRGATPVLEKVLSFTQQRQEVLANNISNLDTVGYKAKDLPAEKFFAALNEAVERREKGGAGARLEIRSTGGISVDSADSMTIQPIEIEDSNILFHDENNRFIEKQMSEMSQNALLHNLATEMLRAKYGGLQTAIRGRL